MDKMKRLSDTIRSLIEGEFSGYIKINFTQGSLGRVEKSEEFEDASMILAVEHESGRVPDAASMNPHMGHLRKLPVMIAAVGLTVMVGSACASDAPEVSAAHSASHKSVRTVKPGDTADVHFLCRLSNDEVAASTESVPADLKKSKLFLQRKDSSAYPVIVPKTDTSFPAKKEKPFEQEILDRLAPRLAGMKEGERRLVTLTAERIADRDDHGYITRIARVRARPKEMRMKKGDYEFRAKKNAEVGQHLRIDPAVSGVVQSISGDEVVLKIIARPGTVLQTPFGPATVLERENSYEVRIDAAPGDVVRTGVFAGRIIAVDEREMTIDYRHPFAFEALQCDVRVEKTAEPRTAASGKGA
jgi:FKBP-type peptidyl-prolyl cis-trans isomerase 2